MQRYKITFNHTEKIERETIIEAASEKEARAIFHDDPYEGDVTDTGNVEGLSIDFESIEEV